MECKEKSIAITIDVESDWGGRSRTYKGVENCVPIILDLLDELEIKATFFTSGDVVRDNKDIICEVSGLGHEIASHGFKHDVDYSRLSKEELFNQIDISKELIESEVGIKPLGFRTPQFRINAHLFEVLSDLGFKYDSSMATGILPSRYSGLSIPSEPFSKKCILEIPVSTMPYTRLPLGLLWITAMGFDVFRFLMKRSKSMSHITLYLHPFDLLQDKPKGDFNFLISSWYNYKAHSAKNTLQKLIRYWSREGRRFITLKELLHVP